MKTLTFYTEDILDRIEDSHIDEDMPEKIELTPAEALIAGLISEEEFKQHQKDQKI